MEYLQSLETVYKHGLIGLSLYLFSYLVVGSHVEQWISNGRSTISRVFRIVTGALILVYMYGSLAASVLYFIYQLFWGK